MWSPHPLVAWNLLNLIPWSFAWHWQLLARSCLLKALRYPRAKMSSRAIYHLTACFRGPRDSPTSKMMPNVDGWLYFRLLHWVQTTIRPYILVERALATELLAHQHILQECPMDLCLALRPFDSSCITMGWVRSFCLDAYITCKSICMSFKALFKSVTMYWESASIRMREFRNSTLRMTWKLS